MSSETTSANFTNHRDVLLAVQELILADMADLSFSEATVVVSDDPSPPANMRAQLFMTICPGDSQFPDDVQTGGGADTVEELAVVLVTLFSARKTDQVGRMPLAVYDPERGLLEIKRRVMRALVGQYPDRNRFPLLSDCIKIRRSTMPRCDESGLYSLMLEFGTSFFWDLT